MYKALNQRTQKEVVILGQEWRGRIAELRALDHQDALVCQGCLQPVRVRAPLRRRTHFAHKHLMGCSYGRESPAVLEARALIYEWLLEKFPSQVTVEKKIEGFDFPRPIDCWVKTPEGSFACWVIESTIKYTTRQAIFTGFNKVGIPVVWILLEKMRHADNGNPNQLHLSPTERNYLRTTPFDEIPRGLADTDSPPGQSLHYLDPAAGTLTTYRDLLLVHPPQLFRGRIIKAPLFNVLIAPENGEITHPGELQRRENYLLELQQKRRATRERKDWINAWSPQQFSLKSMKTNLPGPKIGSPIIENVPEKARCIHCGQITSNWWTVWGKAGERQCKCRDCLAKGLK